MSLHTSPSLRSYRQLSRWLPFHHLDEKLTGLFFCALLVPLLTLIGCVLVGGSLPARAAVIPVMMASLLGAGLALWGLQQLLAPLRISQDALRGHGRGQRLQPLPTDLRDDMGQLLRDLRQALETSESRGQSVQSLSFDDALTGLPNQRFAAEYLRLCVHAADRAGVRLSVALIDPDPVAPPTTLLAPDDSARVMRRLGGFLKQWLKRRSDWVGRWHGEQFLAVMFSDQGHAVEYLDNLRREFSRQMLGLEGSSLSVNIAVAELRPHETPEEFLGRLEEELRSARCLQLESPPPTSANVYSLAAALRKSRGR
jgi:diguanylate cyclase (GGDEF)-like protein